MPSDGTENAENVIKELKQTNQNARNLRTTEFGWSAANCYYKVENGPDISTENIYLCRR